MRADMEQILIDNDKLIWDVAHKFAFKYGHPAEDLYSFGRQIIVQKYNKWNPLKSKFTTFAVLVLRNSFHIYCQREVKVQYRDPVEFVEVIQETSNSGFFLEEIGNVLSWDANEVVDVCVEIMDDLNEVGKREAKAKIRTALMDRFGWTMEAVGELYTEIRQVLKEI